MQSLPCGMWLLVLASVVFVSTDSAHALLPTIIDLDVPFKSESSLVVRIFGDDVEERLNALAFGDVDGDGFLNNGPPGGPGEECDEGWASLGGTIVYHRRTPQTS